ncbi:MAG TPA: 3-phosphoshikimate 1-carboxyvinyltransferase, partial [Burkholderiaceae bacterium]|nr:3-phosphoshikimate 1-carboxyvinyltransferase [Burkholderiaceae bacterium]
TVVSGAEELRVKESDRIAAMADGLRELGVAATPTPDGMTIDGREGDVAFGGGRIGSHGDHRIAMAFAVASLRANGTIEIDDTRNVATSFPGFVELATAAGIDIERRRG